VGDGGAGGQGPAGSAGASGGPPAAGGAQGDGGASGGRAQGGSTEAGRGGQPGGGQGGRSEGGQGGEPPGGAGGVDLQPAVHYVGRVDTKEPDVARFAWSGSGAIVRFRGTSLAVKLAGGQQYTVLVDGKVGAKLVAAEGNNALAAGLVDGEHTVELYRRTEAAEGEAQILGFDWGEGELLPPAPVTRRLEFVGDSITCGYGVDGPDMNCGFSPDTENHYLTYAALAARNLQAELSTVAWSGKGVVCNYGDDASSCVDPLPTYYERALPSRADSAWDFSRFQPDAVVVNLGTNDFSTAVDPDQATFVAGYRALLTRIRGHYPNAHILCTNGPMLSGADLATLRGYLQSVVTELSDPKVSTFEIPPQDGSDGFGCDWHPSAARHQKVAAVVEAALRDALGW
jgi:lysophospholipase L1-like esterase